LSAGRKKKGERTKGSTKPVLTNDPTTRNGREIPQKKLLQGVGRSEKMESSTGVTDSQSV